MSTDPSGNPGSGADPWNPAQYERFKQERSQPFYDLLALVDLPEAKSGTAEQYRAIDLGCGTGELTAALHRALAAQGRSVLSTGLDNSPAMLEKARGHSGGGLSFEQASIADFAGLPADYASLDPGRSAAPAAPSSNGKHDSLPYTGNFDLIFSNAALQYIENHSALLAALSARLNPGGQLAVQMPANDAHPAYALAQSIAAEEPFAPALGGYVRRSPVLAPEKYSELLAQLGFAQQHVRLQVYLHTLAEVSELVEWVRGTLLNNYKQRLSPELYELFVALYRERLLDLLGDEQPYFFTFNRVLLWGRL